MFDHFGSNLLLHATKVQQRSSTLFENLNSHLNLAVNLDLWRTKHNSNVGKQ